MDAIIQVSKAHNELLLPVSTTMNQVHMESWHPKCIGLEVLKAMPTTCIPGMDPITTDVNEESREQPDYHKCFDILHIAIMKFSSIISASCSTAVSKSWQLGRGYSEGSTRASCMIADNRCKFIG